MDDVSDELKAFSDYAAGKRPEDSYVENLVRRMTCQNELFSEEVRDDNFCIGKIGSEIVCAFILQWRIRNIGLLL